MPVDDCGKARARGIEVELLHIMQKVDADSSYFEDICRRQGFGPSCGVDISADRCDRSDPFQFTENLGVTDISGMNDGFGAAQSCERFGAKQPMGIGDNADAECLLALHNGNYSPTSILDLGSR